MGERDSNGAGDSGARRPTAWPPVLVPEDVAALLGLQNARAARAFVERHHIPHVRAGRRLLVLLDSLVEYLKEHETTTTRGDALLAAANKIRSEGRAAKHAVMERHRRKR